MQSDDPRIRQEQIHGEHVFLPSIEAWRQIHKEGSLDGKPIPILRFVEAWLAEFGKFSAAHLGLRQLRGEWHVLPLLFLKGRYYRVHFEDVICEHCGKRCGPSAIREGVAYAGSPYSGEQVDADFKKLPIKKCPHCKGFLKGRGTIWLAVEDEENHGGK